MPPLVRVLALVQAWTLVRAWALARARAPVWELELELELVQAAAVPARAQLAAWAPYGLTVRERWRLERSLV